MLLLFMWCTACPHQSAACVLYWLNGHMIKTLIMCTALLAKLSPASQSTANQTRGQFAKGLNSRRVRARACVCTCVSAHVFTSMRHASVSSLKGISGSGRGEGRQYGGRFSRISNSSPRSERASSPRSAAPAATCCHTAQTSSSMSGG